MVMCWRVSAHTYTLMHCNSQSRLYIGTLPVCTVHFHVYVNGGYTGLCGHDLRVKLWLE